MSPKKPKIIILPELETLIPPLQNEEFKLLKESIEMYGCREPLIVWDRDDVGDFVLVDGHNRYRICTELKVKFDIHKMTFTSLTIAREWMIENQLGRRNLTPTQASYLRGLRYNYEKKGRGGFGKVLSKGQHLPTTAKSIATEYGVSEKTVKRDAQFAQGIEKIGSINLEIKQDILSGKAKVSKTAVQKFSKLEGNQFDLYTPQDISKVIKEFSEDVNSNPTTPVTPIRLPKKKIEHEPISLQSTDELEALQQEAIKLLDQYLQWLGTESDYGKPCAAASTNVKTKDHKFDYTISFDVVHFPIHWLNDLPVKLYHVGKSSIGFEVEQKNYSGLIKCIKHVMDGGKVNDHVLDIVQKDLYYSIVAILPFYDIDELAEQLHLSSSKLYQRLADGDLSINQLRYICDYMNRTPNKLDKAQNIKGSK